MRKKFIVVILIGILIIIFGLSNKGLHILEEEKDQLSDEVTQLEEMIVEKDHRIEQLEKLNENKTEKLKELTETVKMVRASSYARLDDYEDIFDYLEDKYKIHSEYVIEDDWYVINDDYFQIELLGYENAKKVDFYIQRLESNEEEILVFSDRKSKDGWIYTDNNISEIIEKHKEPLVTGGFSYKANFLIYAKVTLRNGKVIRTSKLPIYNK